MTAQRHDDRYQARGVSASKSEVHDAIKNCDEGLFPKAFCKIIPDSITGDDDYCMVMHADGAGTKSSLAYLAWKEGFGDEVWAGIAQDSLVMNVDDCACIGSLGPYLVSNTIGRNSKVIPGSVIASIINGYQAVCDTLKDEGIECNMCGGETADVGDLVRTVIADSTVTTRLRKDEVIDTANIKVGDKIVSFSSTGKAKWETVANAGMGSNGLTSARHEALGKDYAEKYPETYAPEVPKELVYCGKYGMNEKLPGDESFTIGSALLSPTRTYLPLIKELIEKVGRENIHALIHCSGGGQTKILNFGPIDKAVHFVKDNLLPTPPLFKMLQESTGQNWAEMYSVFNMGARLEAILPEEFAEQCIEISKACGIDAIISGCVEEGKGEKNTLTIIAEGGTHQYS